MRNMHDMHAARAMQVTPLRRLTVMPVLDYEPVVCRTCPGVLNPYAPVDYKSMAWACPIWCRTLNPAHLVPHLVQIFRINRPCVCMMLMLSRPSGVCIGTSDGLRFWVVSPASTSAIRTTCAIDGLGESHLRPLVVSVT